MEKVVELRNSMKKKKPVFIKQMGRQKIRLKNKWRRPRGSDSKIKICKKGYPKKIKIGYKSPKEAKDLNREGLNVVVVKSLLELTGIDKTKDIVCIAKIGQKKKIDVVKKCIEDGLNISNLKDPTKFLKEIENVLSKKKEDKTKKEAAKKKKAEKASEKKDAETKASEPKGAEKKEGIEAKVEDKDADQKKKQEKDKLLTKREL